MTDVTAGMVRPFGQKDRLDPAFEKFVVEFRRRLRCGNWAANGHCGESRHGYESTTRHSAFHPRCGGSNLDRTSNASFDKLDLVPDGIRRCGGTLARPHWAVRAMSSLPR